MNNLSQNIKEAFALRSFDLFCFFKSGHIKKSQICIYMYKMQFMNSQILVNRGLNIRRFCKFVEFLSAVVECLTRDRRAAGWSLTGVTALCP